MITYKLVQNMNPTIKACYLKWYARPVVEETVDLDGLAEHMANHNSPYSKGTLVGILTDMVACIKEQLLDGKNIRIDDLAIFSVGIETNGGAESQEDFSLSKNVKGVRLRARATGELSKTQLNLEATLKRASLDKNESSESDSSDSSSDNGASGNGSSSNGSTSNGSSSNGSTSNGSSNKYDDDDML